MYIININYIAGELKNSGSVRNGTLSSLICACKILVSREISISYYYGCNKC